MPDQPGEFHDHVVATLATLVTGQDAIKEGQSGIALRLDKVNGSISHLYERSNQLALDLVNHQVSVLKLIKTHEDNCPAIPKLDELSKRLDRGDFTGSKEVRERLDKFNLDERTRIAAETAEKQVKEKIFDKYGIPILKIAGIIIIGLALEHANVFVSIFKGILGIK